MLNLLLNWLPFSSRGLAARLKGVGGFTGQGKVQYLSNGDGEKRMNIVLSGVAGRTADIFANGSKATSVDLKSGRIASRLDTRRGEDVPTLAEGAQIEIHQNGDLILEGVLQAH